LWPGTGTWTTRGRLEFSRGVGGAGQLAPVAGPDKIEVTIGIGFVEETGDAGREVKIRETPVERVRWICRTGKGIAQRTVGQVTKGSAAVQGRTGRWGFAEREAGTAATTGASGSECGSDLCGAALQFVIQPSELLTALELIGGRAEPGEHDQKQDAVPQLESPTD
jgi:hypothetical protein